MTPTTNIALRAARAASKILLRYSDRVDSLRVSEKSTNDFVTEVDRSAEQAIIDVLRKSFPSHRILAEESGLHEGEDPLWIIDPLDGTTNYLHGVPQFAISIALQVRGKLECALVYDPVRDEVFSADRGRGAYLNERRIRVSEAKDLHGALLATGIPFRDQSQMDAYLGMLKALTKDTAGIRRPGSAALDLAWTAAGRFDGFWELALSPWDIAGGALLIQEAGGTISNMRGGDNFLTSGNIVAGSLKVQKAILETIAPHLNDQIDPK